MSLQNEKERIIAVDSFQSRKMGQDSSEIRLTVVFDNNPLILGLQTAWGFACVAEVGETTLLFDTGGNGAILLDNMNKLGIAPKTVQLVIISHIHYDHLGGLGDFLARNPEVTVYIPQSFPREVSKDIENRGAIPIRITCFTELLSNVFTLGELHGIISEQSMTMRTPKGLVIVTGCAHPGIVNILERAKSVFPEEPIYLVMGGFHLGSLGQTKISKVVESFQRLKVQKVAPCHCSGENARKIFKKSYGENYIEMGVGGIITINVPD